MNFTYILRPVLILLIVISGSLLSVRILHAEVDAPEFTVYKDPQCGCCSKWAEHMDQFGFDLSLENTNSLQLIKARYGIGPRYSSCHTAVEQHSGYVFEGHIPANLIQRFLEERPENAIGLSVPGMPVGSPGMEMGDRHQPYEVLQLNNDGTANRYAFID